MKLSSSRTASKRAFHLTPVAIGMCLCIVAGMAGLLALSSCATSPEAAAHQMYVIDGLTNTIAALRTSTPYLPQPAGGIVEALLAAATAGLAAWSAHLHNSVRTLKNGSAGKKTS